MHNSPLLVPILSHIPQHTSFQPIYLKNIVVLFYQLHLHLPSDPPSLTFSHQYTIFIHLSSHACHMAHPSYNPSWTQPSKIRQTVQVMYLLHNQFYRVTCYLFHFRSKYSHLHPVLQHLELMCLMSTTKFHIHTKLDKIIANVYAFTQKMGRWKILNQKVPGILKM